MTKILIGCDPELFVAEVETGEFVCADGLIPGTKEKPYSIGPEGSIQVDGCAVEFNITPAETLEEFQYNIAATLKELKKHLGPQYTLVTQPTVNFRSDKFKEFPENAKRLGCEPDYMSLGKNPGGQSVISPDAAKKPFRTASGHVHVGWREGGPITPEHMEDCITYASIFSSVFSTRYINDVWGYRTYEEEAKRRQLYGANGAFRPKSYGVECRALGNSWLSKETSIRQIFVISKGITECLFEGMEHEHIRTEVLSGRRQKRYG